MANYPAQIDTTQSLPTVVDNLTPVQGIVVNRLRDAILSIETALGTNPFGVYSSVGARISVLENFTNSLQIIELHQDLGGALSAPLVIGLQGRPLSNVLPIVNQTLAWNGIAWGPSNVPAGGDLLGTYPNPYVVKLYGKNVSSNSPTDTYVLTWVAANNDWEPKISFNAGGDLGGSLTNQNVLKINGASVPAAGALATGNVLKVNGNSTLTYGPVNLAAGPNSITGILPISNQANQILLGDVTGSTNSNTVSALQGHTLSNLTPILNQTLSWTGFNWAPSNVPAGGDLLGTYPNPTINSLQGLLISNGTTASANTAAIIGYNPIWLQPKDITYDGYFLWIADQSNNFVTQQSTDYDISDTRYYSSINYNLPSGYHPVCITYSNGYVFVGCSGYPGYNRLVVINAATGAIVGLGKFSYSYITNGAVVGITVDDSGNVWTVDTHFLSGFNISSLLSSYPTPVAPSSSLAISGCCDVVFGITGSLSHHYLFVCDNTYSHIYSINPATTSITATYTDSGGRAFGHLFFGGGVAGTISIWASTGSTNQLVRLNPDTMTVIANITNGGTATSMGYIGCDGTYIYVGDNNSGIIGLYNPSSNTWYTDLYNALIIQTPNTSITSTGGMVFDGTYVNVCQQASNPSGYQGLAQFNTSVLEYGSFLIGPNQLQYTTYTTLAGYLSNYKPVRNTIPIRGSSGEAIFSEVWQNATSAAQSGFIRTTSANQPIIAAKSEVNPSNDIDVLSTDGADGIILGDSVNGVQTKVQTFGTSITLLNETITMVGGRVEVPKVFTNNPTYAINSVDRTLIYKGTSGGKTFTLPAASGSGRILTFCNSSSGAANGTNAITITPNGSDKIGNSLAWLLQGGDAWITIQDSASAQWTIIARSYNNVAAIATSAYQINEYDDFVPCNSSSGAFTITLPASTVIGEKHEINDIYGSAVTHNIAISGNGNLINSSSSNVVLNVNFGKKILIWFGSPIGWQSSTLSP